MLLLPLYYTQIGYYGQTIILQWRMKEAAREARIAVLPDDAFLRVSLAEVNAAGRWEEAGKECWYKGHLYDVIRRRTVGETTWLYCLDDESEERLIHGAVDVTKASQDQPIKQNGHSLTPALGDMICETITWKISPLPVRLPQYHSRGEDRLSALPTEIVIPPPKADAVLFG